MLKHTLSGLMRLRLTVVILCSILAANVQAGQFPTIKSETLDGKEFIFPKDLKGEKQDVLFLSITNSQENGIAQQEQMLKWEAAIRESGGLPNNQTAYFFAVMKSPPFFVKGFIRKDMKEKYNNKVSLDRLGVLFVDNLQEFSNASGIPADGEPTIVVADKTGNPLTVIKGGVTPEKIQQLKAALK